MQRPNPTRSQSPSRPQLPPLWLRLLRRPIHALLIALLLWPPQAWAAIAPAGSGAGSPERADVAPPTELLRGTSGGADATAAAGGDAEGGGPGDTTTAALSAKEAASGLDPDLEALIEEEEKAEGREAQASSSTSDGGTGDAGGATPFGAAVGATPQVDYFTGGARLEIPIQVPPGRRDATPSLNLVYSSSAGDSPWGFGWSLPIGHIARSTKWGVPGCPLNERDAKADYVLSLNGSSLELIRPQAKKNRYHARIGESYLEGGASGGKKNRWGFRDRAGNQYYFGEVEAAKVHSGAGLFYNHRYNQTSGANCDFTTFWALTSFFSPNGNEIKYHYTKHKNVVYLRAIEYGQNRWAARLREPAFRVEFTRSIRPIHRDRGTPRNDPNIHPWVPTPRSITYARGVLQQRYYVIDGIRVLYRPGPGKSFKLIRQVKLDYQDDRYTGRSFLQRVRTLDPAGKALVPPQTFEYASSQLTFANQVSVKGPITSFADTERLAYTTTLGIDVELQIRGPLDANGDGYIDLIGASDDVVGWVMPGTAAGIPGKIFKWKGVGLPSTTHLSWDKVKRRARFGRSRFADFTGDGIPDRLTAGSEGKWYLSRGACTKLFACQDGPRTAMVAPDRWLQASATAERQTRLHRTLMDWNADGLPDFVRADLPPRWRVHRNTGSAFERIPIQGRYTFPEIEYSDKHGDQWITRTMTLDVNGDGLPDKLVYDWDHCVTFDVRGNVAGRYPLHNCSAAVKAFRIDRSKVVFSNVVYVYLNSGRGFDRLVTWYLPSWGGGASSNQGIRRQIEQKQGSRVTGGGTVQDLRDMNSDGLPDFVEIQRGKWRVTYNQGGVIDVSQNPTATLNVGGNWISQYSSTRPSKTPLYRTSTGIDLLDIDGDSVPELVNGWDMARWKVTKLRAPGGAPLIRPGLLVRAKNGLGGVAELRYRPSTRYDNRDTAGAPPPAPDPLGGQRAAPERRLVQPGPGRCLRPRPKPLRRHRPRPDYPLLVPGRPLPRREPRVPRLRRGHGHRRRRQRSRAPVLSERQTTGQARSRGAISRLPRSRSRLLPDRVPMGHPGSQPRPDPDLSGRAQRERSSISPRTAATTAACSNATSLPTTMAV